MAGGEAQRFGAELEGCTSSAKSPPQPRCSSHSTDWCTRGGVSSGRTPAPCDRLRSVIEPGPEVSQARGSRCRFQREAQGPYRAQGHDRSSHRLGRCAESRLEYGRERLESRLLSRFIQALPPALLQALSQAPSQALPYTLPQTLVLDGPIGDGIAHVVPPYDRGEHPIGESQACEQERDGKELSSLLCARFVAFHPLHGRANRPGVRPAHERDEREQAQRSMSKCRLGVFFPNAHDSILQQLPSAVRIHMCEELRQRLASGRQTNGYRVDGQPVLG